MPCSAHAGAVASPQAFVPRQDRHKAGRHGHSGFSGAGADGRPRGRKADAAAGMVERGAADGDRAAAAGRRGGALRLFVADGVGRRDRVAVVPVAGDDGFGAGDAPQRTPAADAGGREDARAPARLRAGVRAGGGGRHAARAGACPSLEYAREEWAIHTPELDLPERVPRLGDRLRRARDARRGGDLRAAHRDAAPARCGRAAARRTGAGVLGRLAAAAATGHAQHRDLPRRHWSRCAWPPACRSASASAWRR